MFRNQVVISSLLAITGIFSSACYVESGPPPPAQPVVYQQPAPAPVAAPEPTPAAAVVVEAPPAPPPAPPAEPVPPPPSPDHVWVAGYHRWDGHRYVYERGRYERRPRPNARHVPGHWERRGRGHVWVESHWD